MRSYLSNLRQSGFSLVEILLVIVIILMLAGAVVVYVLPQQEGAQRNTTRIKLQQIQGALDNYKINVGTYPNEEEGGLGALIRRPTFADERLAERWSGPYLKPGATIDDVWGRPIAYEFVDKSLLADKSGPDFRLYSVGPDGQPETEDDVKLFTEAIGPDGLPTTEQPAGTPAPATPGAP